MKTSLMESALIESKSVFNEFDIVNSYLIEVDYITEAEAVDIIMFLSEGTVKDHLAGIKAEAKAKVAKIRDIGTSKEVKAMKHQDMSIKALSDSPGVNMSAPSTKAKVARIKEATKARIAAIRKWVADQIAKVIAGAKKAAAAVRARFNSVRGNVAAKLKKAPAETGAVKTAGKGPSVGQKLSGLGSKVAGAAKGKGKYAAGAAGAAVVGYGGAKLYKNYLSKAARACAGKTGEDKAKCMAKFRTEAAKVRLEYLKSSMEKCKGTGDPYLCKKMIKEQIDLKLK